MVLQCKKLSRLVLLPAVVLIFSWMQPSWVMGESGGKSDFTKFGDVMMIALPATGLLGTIIKDDPEGRFQWMQVQASQLLTVEAVKHTVRKSRPDAVGKSSFPSGHTSGAFSGAAFIDVRYGHKWGIPAYILAILTGASRINADAHFVNDVAAGASVGMMYNWYFTSPYSERFALLPAQMGDEGYGVKLTMNLGAVSYPANSKKAAIPKTIKYPNYTYVFRFGPAWQGKNIIRAPSNGGTEFDFDDYENIDDPIMVADIFLDMHLAKRHGEEIQAVQCRRLFSCHSGSEVKTRYQLSLSKGQFRFGIWG